MSWHDRFASSHLSVFVVLGISCHVQGPAWGKPAELRGNARTWEPLANPPSARHGTFAEQGPPTLKACNREQTQQRDHHCTGLTILADESTSLPLSAEEEAHSNGSKTDCVSAVWHGGEQGLTNMKMISFCRHLSGVWQGGLVFLGRLRTAGM